MSTNWIKITDGENPTMMNNGINYEVQQGILGLLQTTQNALNQLTVLRHHDIFLREKYCEMVALHERLTAYWITLMEKQKLGDSGT